SKHKNQGVHDCQNRHYCTEKCSQHPQCDKICLYDASYDIYIMIFMIFIYDVYMIFKNHFHQTLIGNKQVNELKALIDGVGEKHVINYHICGTEYTCADNCAQPGICAIDYDITEKEWTNELNTFPYKFYEPKPARSKCVVARHAPVPILGLEDWYQLGLVPIPTISS
ncbi:unnamed protein product, partial [Didymodactylos carnosus]